MIIFFNRRQFDAIGRNVRRGRADNAPFTMAAIAPVFPRRYPDICSLPGDDQPSLIHSLNAGCEFRIDKSRLQSRAVHDRVR
ncbi:hypothetical protein NKI72_14985 [Mesorhizobium sp. M0437]|uniref:hypothetical protein n=1 Tax=unclassified Mesorhizobium TaxID=325217 RepID=UPI00333BE130